MFDEPPMPANAAGIAEWLRHPAVIARVNRARINAHGPRASDMAVEADERDRLRRRPRTLARRLRAARAYARMRVGEELTAMDRQALATVLVSGAAIIAVINTLDRAGTYALIGDINGVLRGSGLAQEHLVDAMVAQGEHILWDDPASGRPTSVPAPTNFPVLDDRITEADQKESKDETPSPSGL